MLFSTVTKIIVTISALSQVSIVAADAFSDNVLATHNSVRAKYGARPLQWSPSLYPGTVQFVQRCKFEHSYSQGKYGENLYVTSNPSSTIKDAVAAWAAESSKYNYNQPGFSAATGQFTQLVWKSTTAVSCAVANCPAGAILPQATRFFACRYSPPGNFLGQFPQNVGRQIA